MKSTVSKLIRMALENKETPGYVNYTVYNNSLLKSIEVGVNNGYHSNYVPFYGPTIEVWLHTNYKLEDFAKFDTFSMILEHDTIGTEDRDEWYEKTGVYDYHLENFYSAWLEDIYPDFEQFKIEKKETKKEESLMEFALRHGCDFMDLNTGTIYRAL